MRPTEILMHDHEIVLRALSVLDAMRARALAGTKVPERDLAALLEFFQRFMDACHHAKEEQVLFPALEDLGLPSDGGPIGVMLYEHEEGRKLIAALESGSAPFADAAANFSNLLRSHIHKENEILFRMADRMLPPATQNEIASAFEEHERRVLGPGEHERLTAAVDALATSWLAQARSAV